ncbi:MAG: response regulator [Mucilaginibacter sp.]|uniref:response regulator n=1 Tax=Mucilaginibacter sp. TaxID=1882438 RepID=UPI003264A52E
MTKLNIYIVEDEPILATLLKYTLQGMGHSVCGVAESYDDAVKGLQQTEADLVITDIMLRGPETGIAIARYIKANLNMPFIFLSSISDEEMIADAMSTEPLSYLKKPVNKDALNTAISLFTMLNIPEEKKH